MATMQPIFPFVKQNNIEFDKSEFKISIWVLLFFGRLKQYTFSHREKSYQQDANFIDPNRKENAAKVSQTFAIICSC
ncbi:MAG TPA: hypothetical protein DCM62_01515 [Bacteroidales bacterium]|nr:hypothetical protein [Bacteroidales bacterium]